MFLSSVLLLQALQNKDITIYGNGEQTRSFQYVDDLVNGLIKLMNGNYSQPVNIGNPDEYTVKVLQNLFFLQLCSVFEVIWLTFVSPQELFRLQQFHSKLLI